MEKRAGPDGRRCLNGLVILDVCMLTARRILALPFVQNYAEMQPMREVHFPCRLTRNGRPCPNSQENFKFTRANISQPRFFTCCGGEFPYFCYLACSGDPCVVVG